MDLRLAALAGQFVLDLAKVDRVHDDDVVGAIVAQEGGGDDALPGAGKKFARPVRIDVDDVFDFVMDSEGGEKSDSFGPGAPEYRASAGGRPVDEPMAPCRAAACCCRGEAIAQ